MRKLPLATLFIVAATFVFSNDSIPKPLTWGFKFNYDFARYVPTYVFAVGSEKKLSADASFLNFGLGFQFYGKNKFIYHELSLSRFWHSRQSEGYRFDAVSQLDSSKLYINNENFQIGLRYSFYLQTSSWKKEKRHRFFMEFPLEVFYHFNSAGWYPQSDTVTFRSVSYRTNGIGFTIGVVPHYHCFITNQIYLDLSFPVLYSGMHAFTSAANSRMFDSDVEYGSGYFGGVFDMIQFPFRIALGVKLHEPKKRKTR